MAAAMSNLVAEEPASGTSATGQADRLRGRWRWLALVGAALVCAALAVALGVGQRGSGDRAAAERLVEHVDPDGRFVIGAPAAWRPQVLPDGVLFEAGQRHGVSVRHTRLAAPVQLGDTADLRALTDAVLRAPEAGLQVLAAEPMAIGGLPGIYYLYTFTDPTAGAGGGDATPSTQGAHGHYFAFSGRDMFTIVMQALPASEFAALAPTFDAMAASFAVTATGAPR